MWPFRIWRWRFEIQQASEKFGLEQAILAAIMERESLGGEALTPPTRLGTGDGGHGRGLFQIDDRSHPAFCADIEKWGNALENAMMGASIFAWGLKKTNGHLPGACAVYNAGWAREKDDINGVRHTVPWIRELYAHTPEPDNLTLDRFTTGNDYVQAVMALYDRFKKIQFT